MFTPVDITLGQNSSADPLSSATSSVVNMVVDGGGVGRKRCGLSSYATTGLGSSPFIGLYRYRTYVVGVTADRKIWALSDGAPTVWVALSDTTSATQLDGSRRPVFAEDSSDLFIIGGGALQTWPGTGLTARQSASAPLGSHVLNLGQRLVANSLTAPSNFFYSGLGEGGEGTWGALNFATAEARPDPIVAMYDNTAEIFIFGSSTLEVWGITASATAPYQRINTMNLGCSAAYTPVRVDNQFAWLDNLRRFVLSDGRTYQVISQDIAQDLRQLGTITDGFGWREDTARTNCLVWVFPTAGRCFEYSYGSKRWGERKYYTAPAQGAYPVNSQAYWDAYNLNVVGSSTAAGLYTIDENARTDLGGTMVAERITGWNDFGTPDVKRSSRTRVVMRRGTTALGATDGRLEVAVADDGHGWGAFRIITMGQPSDLEQNVDLFFGGCFIRRRHWLRYSGSDDWAIAGLYEDQDDVENDQQAAG